MHTVIKDRKAYMRDIYSRYWITAREKIYGFSEYDRNLCKLILELSPPKAGGVYIGDWNWYGLSFCGFPIEKGIHGSRNRYCPYPH